jgi:hypothetical protein
MIKEYNIRINTQLRVGHLVISLGATTPPTHFEDGDGVRETSENLDILTRQSARENFIDFCRRESFKTYD